MSGDEFRELLYTLKIWRRELAEFAGVSLRTVNRWCTSGAPLYAVRLAEAAGGMIRRRGAWNGWIAERLHLSGPTGERYTLEELRAAHWLRQLHESIAPTTEPHLTTPAAARPDPDHTRRCAPPSLWGLTARPGQGCRAWTAPATGRGQLPRHSEHKPTQQRKKP